MDKGTVERTVNETTGGQKEQNEVRFDLIPTEAMWEVARLYGIGARKYEAHNWRRGYEWSLSIAALERHLSRWKAGEIMDEGGFHHLAAVVFHALALIIFETEHPELDDRFKPLEARRRQLVEQVRQMQAEHDAKLVEMPSIDDRLAGMLGG